MATANGSGTGAGSVSECEGEEQDDSSSSSNASLSDVTETFDKLNVNKTVEDELEAFRQQWQQELVPNSILETDNGAANVPKEDEPVDDEEKAKRLFLRGMEMERSRKLYEAVQFYKRAIQILPDVEIRLYESSETKTETPEEVPELVEKAQEEYVADSDDEEVIEGEDFMSRMQRILANKGYLCQPEVPTRSGHLSWLPYEVVQLVLRWVAGAELDGAALERAGAVCRGLYVAAREPELWRCLCVKTWGIDCGTPAARGYPTWRAMYWERARLNLDGVYISKTTYIRHGENSYQDHCYKPWYLVDYYRYLRFFPEGMVLMWTTAEEPVACVGQLRHREPRPGLGIVVGHYRLVGDMVVVVIKKTSSEKKQSQLSNTRFRARRKETPEQHDQEFSLQSTRRRRNSRLVWRRYLAHVRGACSAFDLAPGRFPPLAFSAVRAYTAHASAPLLCNA